MKQKNAPKKEIFSWAMFDFANSGYTTVVLTAVFNTYFVGIVAGELGNGSATLLWSITTALSNGIVLFTAPVIGAITDFSRNKKRFLIVATTGCIISTALLATSKSGDIVSAMLLIILSSYLFFTGENLISAFLPEIACKEDMGKISAYAWSLGYFGGILSLGLSLAYINWGKSQGLPVDQYVPHTMLIVALCFALSSLPTFLWLRERGASQTKPENQTYVQIGLMRLRQTWHHAHKYQDLFRFLIAMTIYYCGINTVIVLAAVYAQEVMGFQTEDTIKLILVVNVTAAIGAFLFGFVQDKLGSVKTLSFTLLLWIIATATAFFTNSVSTFWLVANLVGFAMGASQSAGRALVGLFSPEERNGEFFGLWGLATKLSAIIGPLVYGLITFVTKGDHRLGLLSTTVFFVMGLIVLQTVNEKRGIATARNSPEGG